MLCCTFVWHYWCIAFVCILVSYVFIYFLHSRLCKIHAQRGSKLNKVVGNCRHSIGTLSVKITLIPSRCKYIMCTLFVFCLHWLCVCVCYVCVCASECSLLYPTSFILYIISTQLNALQWIYPSIYLSIYRTSVAQIQRKENNSAYRFFELRSKRLKKTFIVFVFLFGAIVEWDVNVVVRLRISASFDLNNLSIAFHTIIYWFGCGLSIAFKLKVKSIRVGFVSFKFSFVSIRYQMKVANACWPKIIERNLIRKFIFLLQNGYLQ